MTDTLSMTNYDGNEDKYSNYNQNPQQGGPNNGYYQPSPPAYSQQPYQTPYRQAPYNAAAATHTNSLATVSMILGFLVFIFGALTGIPAVITGHIALGQIRNTRENGHGMAVTGLILGYLSIILTILGIVILVAVAATVPDSSSYNSGTYNS